MTKNSSKTAGQISQELMAKDSEVCANNKIEVSDIRNEFNKDYVAKVESTIKDGLTKYTGDFYVVVEAKKERLMPNVIRNFIFHAPVCPTPHYDQTVYKYARKNDKTEFLWSIPDKQTCEWMKTCPLEVPEDHRLLLQTVLDYYDDTLLHKAMTLNGETIDNFLIKEIYG